MMIMHRRERVKDQSHYCLNQNQYLSIYQIDLRSFSKLLFKKKKKTV